MVLILRAGHILYKELVSLAHSLYVFSLNTCTQTKNHGNYLQTCTIIIVRNIKFGSNCHNLMAVAREPASYICIGSRDACAVVQVAISPKQQ